MLKLLATIAAGALIAISNCCAAPAAAMREGGNTLAPFSFVKFCIEYPSECPSMSGPASVTLTAARVAELADVNRTVNAAIVPTADRSALRFWHLDARSGDCNEFAVQKRHELLQRGWPAAALALTVVKTSWGEGHLIVTVRTDKGDLVLDSLRSNVISWERTGYDYIKRQSASNPQNWVDLNGGQKAAVDPEKAEEESAPVLRVEASAQTHAPRPIAAESLHPTMLSGMRRTDASGLRDAGALTHASRKAGARVAEELIADLAIWIDKRRPDFAYYAESLALLDPFRAT
jgi:predicted transglutaminase-like cysteine proteinase